MKAGRRGSKVVSFPDVPYSRIIRGVCQVSEGAKKKVSLLGATAFVVGCVIGAGIFVMTGPLAGDIGPGLYIGYVIALIPALGQGFTYAQLGSALPTTSSQYTYLSTFAHPMIGYAIAWCSLLTGAAILALLGYGFAEYLTVFFPGINEPMVAYLSLLAFYLLHLIGIKSAEFVQSLMVIVMVAVLAVFVIAGLPACRPELAVPLFPKGPGRLLSAAASLFFAYLGFNTVADIGEEVENPGRTIPASIALSALVVGFLYIGVSYVMPRIIPWEELARTKAGVAEAAMKFLPAWFKAVVSVAALFAVATTLNSSFLMNSRLWFAMARDGWLPKWFLTTNKTGAPVWALTASLVSSLIIALTQWGVVYYGTMGSVIVLLATAILAWAPLVLTRKLPEAYARAAFRIPVPVLYVLALVTSGSCLALLVATVRSHPSIWVIIALWLVPGLVIYWIRNKGREVSVGSQAISSGRE